MKNRIAASLLCLALLTGCSGWFGKDKKPPLPGERISVLQLQQKLAPDNGPGEAQSFHLPEPWKNDSWPQAGGYANHAMQNVALNPGHFKLAWKADIGQGGTDRLPLTAQPVIAGGRIFTMDRDLNLSAFDAGTGKKIWSVNVKKKDERDLVIGGGLAVSKDGLFVTNGYSELLAVAPDSGKLIWAIPLPAPSRAAPTVMDDRVFVTTLDNRLIAFDALKGAQLWDYTGLAETAGLVGAASPAAANGIVVPAFSSGELYALLVENGSVSWSENLGSQHYAGGLASIPAIKGLPVIDKDLVFAVSFSGSMIAVDQRTGQRVWQKDLNSDQTPWVAGNGVFLLTLNNELVSLARDSGAIRWVSPLQRYKDPKDHTSDAIYWTGPVLAGGRLILASNLGLVDEVDPQTGKVTAEWKTGYKISLPLAAAGETLYMLADDGTLLAYR